MTENRQFLADYRSDYRVTTAQPFPAPCGSHPRQKIAAQSERKDYLPHRNRGSVVRAVVTQTDGFLRSLGPLTTDYPLDIKKEEEREKTHQEGYAREAVVRSHPRFRSLRTKHPAEIG